MRILLDINQLSQDEVEDFERLRRFYWGTWFVKGNSPTIDARTWKAILKNPYITEDGGLDYEELVPRIGENVRFLNDIGFDPKLCFLYHEHPSTIFSEDKLREGYQITGKKIVTLCRNYAGEAKAAIKENIVSRRCGGVAFELVASKDWVHDTNLLRGISAVRKKHKKCFVILTPNHPSEDYRKDVKEAVSIIKRSEHWNDKNLFIVLCCYEKENTKIGFLGGSNSVEGALKELHLTL